MKVGAEDRSKVATAFGLLMLAMLLIAHWIFSSQSSAFANFAGSPGTSAAPVRPAPKTKLRNVNTLDPTLRLAQLQLTEHRVYQGSGRNIFQSYEGSRPQKTQSAPKPQPTTPTPIPVTKAPTLFEVQFFGIASAPNSPRKVCLIKSGDIFIGTEGNILDRRYKILRIGPNSIDIEDMLKNEDHTLRLQQ